MANFIQSLRQKAGLAIAGFKSQNIFKLTNNNAVKFFEYGGKTVFLDFNNKDNIKKALEECPIITTILSEQAKAFNNGKFQIINKKTGVARSSDGMFKDVLKVIRKPNPLQTQRQFFANMNYNIGSYGNCVVLAIKSQSLLYDIEEPTVSQMWILPNQFVSITIKQGYNFLNGEDWRDFIDKIKFSYNGITTELNIEDIYIFTGETQNLNDLWLPESPLQALQAPITSLINNYDANNEMLYNRGPRGVLSNTTAGNTNVLPLNPEDKQELHDDWRGYGLLSGQKKIIITNASLNWQNMGFNYSELGLGESRKRDIEDIAKGMGHPIHLIASEGTTFNNVNSAEKKLYQDTIIPNANNISEQLSDLLIYDETYTLHIDYSHVNCLQEALLDQSKRKTVDINNATKLFNQNAITYNRMLEMCGEPKVIDMDKYKHELEQFKEEQTQAKENGAIN